MKSKFFCTILLMFTINSSGLYAANTRGCSTDVDQMISQINKYGSITSIDGYRANQVLWPEQTDSKHCLANAYHYGTFVCMLKWEMGNWGNTIHC